MFYQINRKYIWVSDELSLDETVEFLIKKLAKPHEIIHREKYIKLVQNQKK